MRKLGILLIITGLVVSLYPTGERLYSQYRQQVLLAEIEQALETDVLKIAKSAVANTVADNLIAETESHPARANSSPVIGILTIEKISLKIPVLRGMSSKNLRVGAGFLDDSTEIGEKGNTVLAAHRSHTYGHLFNRLNELEAGDRVEITTHDAVYVYEVYSNEVVKLEAVSVLDTEEGESILTLITCHPLYRKDPPFRIVVKANMVGQ